jgi:ubiquinone/menaquinone biosynthesis C-methylase UbiE
MTDTVKFWDKMAEKYSKKPVPSEEIYQIKKDLTREHFTPTSRVFEFGCGTGTTAISHAPFVKHIIATDISPEMLRIAREKARAAEVDNVTFEEWDVSSDHIPGADYDAVLALSILHLVEDLPGALAKCHDLLKDDGILVSSTGCLADRMGYLRPILGVMKMIGKAPAIAFLTSAELEQKLQTAGFQTVYRLRPKGSVSVFVISRKRWPSAPIEITRQKRICSE